MLNLMAKAPRQSGSDGLKAAAGIMLAADRERRRAKARNQATIAKADKRRRDRAASDAMSASDRIDVNALVPPERRRHGDYRNVDFKLVEVTEGGKRKEKTAKVVRNLGGTAIDRWNNRNLLDDRQMAAILFYRTAFHKVFGEGPRVTASYCPAVVRGFRGSVELWASSGIAAKESLRLLDHEVFFRLPIDWFPVWQNVVIWDEAAGVAGSRLGYVHKPAEAVAKEIVKTVARMIADIVIDSSRSDFGEILLDLDAPRRPGRRP